LITITPCGLCRRVLHENSRKITIFGGKLRTPSPGEFVVSGIIAFIAFVVLGSERLYMTSVLWISKNFMSTGLRLFEGKLFFLKYFN
jgi:hypothetical protein